MNVSRYGQSLPQTPQTSTSVIAQKTEILDGGNAGRYQQKPAPAAKLAGAQPLNSSGRGQFVNLIV